MTDRAEALIQELEAQIKQLRQDYAILLERWKEATAQKQNPSPENYLLRDEHEL